MKYTVSIDTPEDEAQFQRFLAQHPGVVAQPERPNYASPGPPMSRAEFNEMIARGLKDVEEGRFVSFEELKIRAANRKSR